MNKSEENLNAWLEGRLTGQALADFEASLPEISEAELAQQEDRQLTALLKKHIGAPTMTNQEFFNHQLRSEIERDQPQWAPGRRHGEGACKLEQNREGRAIIVRPR